MIRPVLLSNSIISIFGTSRARFGAMGWEEKCKKLFSCMMLANTNFIEQIFSFKCKDLASEKRVRFCY